MTTLWDQEVATSGRAMSKNPVGLPHCGVWFRMKCELGTPVTGPFLVIQWDYVCMGALAADKARLGWK